MGTLGVLRSHSGDRENRRCPTTALNTEFMSACMFNVIIIYICTMNSIKYKIRWMFVDK